MPTPPNFPRFYPILDTAILANRGIAPLLAAEVLLQAGTRILQYRHKAAWTQAQYDEAKRLAELCSEASVLFVLNDRGDFAHLIGAALHLGQQDLPPRAARKVVSPTTTIGFSTHNRMQLERGNQEPVQYLSIGPIFDTTSKGKPDPVVGIEGLRRLRKLTEKTMVAIGGITLENAASVLQAGADSLAVISGVFPESADRLALRQVAEQWITTSGST